ncbi:TnsA endonuclease N-terminal domain-containing protein [uncultured Bosea sp.]|uniref:TnsA endonuclease N-terminal domain-containing protein n=1 Tax=uncultured Bosea sp. TaxID=211457 RepID=UPI0025F92516|nr:TnsA endonuclease N-terminal domain-containing protein [uncultured Bosea sp.]
MRRIVPPNNESIAGFLPTRFPARQLHYESNLERDFLILLEIDIGIGAVVTQPLTLKLDVDGRERSYTPDILAVWWDESHFTYGTKKVVFEVKPYDILKRDFSKLAPELRAAKRHFASRGIGFRVVTDRSIYCARQANAALLAPHVRSPMFMDIMETIVDFMTSPDVLIQRKLGEVRQRIMADGVLRETAQDALYQMVGMGFLKTDLDVPLSDDTVVKWFSTVAVEEMPLESD